METFTRNTVGWRLYYGNGTVASSMTSTWEKAPSEDVQILIVYYDEKYKIWHDDHQDEENYRDMYFGKDYYWQYGNGQVADVPRGAEVKLGRELPQDEWRALYNRALQDTKWQRT